MRATVLLLAALGCADPEAAPVPPPPTAPIPVLVVGPPPVTPVTVLGTIGLAPEPRLAAEGAPSSVRVGLGVVEPSGAWPADVLGTALAGVVPALTECHRVARTTSPALFGRVWVRVAALPGGGVAAALTAPPTETAPRAEWVTYGSSATATPDARLLESCTLTALHAIGLPHVDSASVVFLVSYQVVGGMADVPLSEIPPFDPDAVPPASPTGHVGS
jgi:hypothetical protein